MESFKVHARTTGKGLHRSLSFISKSSDDDSEQFEFRRRVQTSATGLDKPKQRVRPRPYCSGSSKKKERALKDGFVWMQIVPHKKKSWQLRYFMIFKEKLCYLEEPATSSSKGMEWKEIRPCDIVSVKIPNEIHLFNSNQTSYMVSLKTNSRFSRTKMLLRFKSQEERDEWITAFLMAKSWSLLDEKKEEF